MDRTVLSAQLSINTFHNKRGWHLILNEDDVFLLLICSPENKWIPFRNNDCQSFTLMTLLCVVNKLFIYGRPQQSSSDCHWLHHENKYFCKCDRTRGPSHVYWSIKNGLCFCRFSSPPFLLLWYSFWPFALFTVSLQSRGFFKAFKTRYFCVRRLLFRKRKSQKGHVCVCVCLCVCVCVSVRVCALVRSVVYWRVFREQISLTLTAPKQYRFGN